MKAEVLPLTGKHYGTSIRIEDGDHVGTITVWLPNGVPSEVELHDMFGITVDQYVANVQVPAGWYGEMVSVQSEYPCDSHYQSQFEYDVCRRIADALTDR